MALSDIIFKNRTEMPSSPVKIEDLEAMTEESSLMLKDAIRTRELVETDRGVGRPPDKRGFKGDFVAKLFLV